MKYKVILLWLLSCYLAFGQTIKTETVSFNLSSRDFETALPFDVPFKIKGTADKKVRKIYFSYRIKGRKIKDWYYFPDADSLKNISDFTKPEIWTRISDSDDKYSLPVGPIHPNVVYEFKFDLLLSVELNEADNTTLKADLLSLMNATFSQEGIDEPKLRTLSSNIESRIKIAASSDGLYDINRNVQTIDPLTPPIDRISRKILELSPKIPDAKGRITAYANIIKQNLYKDCSNVSNKFIMDKILSKEIKLAPSINALLEKPLDPTIKDYETFRLMDFFQFYSEGLLNKKNIESLLDGTGKIAATGITPLSEYSIESLKLLQSFYKLISSSYFTNTDNIPVFQTCKADFIKMAEQIDKILNELQIISNLKKELTELKTLFPNVLKDKLILQSYNVFEESAIDVTAEKNSYIGLDFGVVYAPFLNNLFTYEGVNVYLKPVNKKARLSTLQGCDKLGKIFSFYFGMTQKAAGPKDPQYKDLFDNNGGNLLTGFGFRFNRIARFNFGGLIYQYKNPNPVKNRYDLKVSPTISLSLDFDVAKAVGNVGKRLGFNN